MSGVENLVRREVIETAATLVIKVGTAVLSNSDDTLDTRRVAVLAEAIHRVRQTGRRVVLVSSGAIGAGIGLLKLNRRPRDLPHLQAAAATGQAHLIRVYDDCLRKHGYHAAQLLLTAGDFDHRTRYLNIRNTLYTLFEYDAIPIVNENDTVSVDEIKFSDNDHLAALVTSVLPRPLLVILSTVDGLFEGDPQHPSSKVIPMVQRWSDSLNENVRNTSSHRGTGGMRTKLKAIRAATAMGENVIIANGTIDNVLDEILAGKEIGTLFLAQGASVPAWKRWIGYTVIPKGRCYLDDGARRAIVESGRSLLAIGITNVDGEFSLGDIVVLVDSQGTEFARGLTNYSASDLRSIAGKRTEEITRILGDMPYDEVIHRNDLVLTGRA